MFIVGLVTKTIRTLNNLVDPVAGGLLQIELRVVLDELSSRRAAWTRFSMDNASAEAYLRIDMPLTCAGRFPN
jgi:hypothetical protein